MKLSSAIAVAFAATIVSAPQSKAQDYPARPVEFIVGAGAGGGGDTAQRLFNKFAEPLVGQRLLVTNKPGAGGVIGWAEVVRAAPDGYLLGYTSPPSNIIPALAKPKETGYTLDQFTNICTYSVIPGALLVPENSPHKTLADFISFAKQNPKKIKIATQGTLSADSMAGLLIASVADIETTALPFDSGSKSAQATISGVADAMIGSALYAVSQKGALRPLGIASSERHSMVPDVPTFKEQGINVVAERFRGIVGPKDLPAEIVAYWADVCEKVTSDPEFQAAMLNIGQPSAFKGPDDMTAMIDTSTAEIKQLIEKHNLAQ